MNKVIIVGGGAAGMLASVIAARNGCEVLLFEKNEKLGKKVYITVNELTHPFFIFAKPITICFTNSSPTTKFIRII